MNGTLTQDAPRVPHMFGQWPWEQPQFYSQLSRDTNNQRNFFIFETLKTDPRFAKRADGDDSWLQLSQIPGFVREIHRFSDRRQEIFEGKPLLDGSNIGQIFIGEDGVEKINGSQGLHNMYMLYRRWLTFIHYENMIELKPCTLGFTVIPGFEYNSTRIEHGLRIQLAAAVTNLMKQELSEIENNWGTSEYEAAEDVAWILNWRLEINNILADMLAACNWARTNNKVCFRQCNR